MTLSSTSTCGGECCAVFFLPVEADWSKVIDGPYVADMIVPLTKEQATERWATFVGDKKELPDLDDSRGYFTCRHWDEESRLCGAYESRPDLCRNYPYGMACSHGCDYQITDPKIAERYGNGTWEWDADAKGWRPRSSVFFLWDAENGLLKPVPTETPA